MGSSHGAYNVDSRMPRTERVTSRVIVYRSIDSTNIEAGRLLQDGTLQLNDGSVVAIAADTQSAGRGRLDHAWVSRPGESFAVTFVTTVPRWLALDASVNGWLQMIAGLATVDGLRGAMRECGAQSIATMNDDADGAGFMLKWPNDVFLGGHKLGGILSQMASLPMGSMTEEYNDDNKGADRIAIIFGIGLNLAIDAEYLPTAQSTSLQLHYAPLPDAESLRARLRGFAADPHRQAHDLRDEVEKICYTLGRHAVAHYVDGSEMEGEAVALYADASLDLRTADGIVHTIRTADVGVLPKPCV